MLQGQNEIWAQRAFTLKEIIQLHIILLLMDNAVESRIRGCLTDLHVYSISIAAISIFTSACTVSVSSMTVEHAGGS